MCVMDSELKVQHWVKRPGWSSVTLTVLMLMDILLKGNVA